MNLKILEITSSCIIFELITNDIFFLDAELEIQLLDNKEKIIKSKYSKNVVNSLYNLNSNFSYIIRILSKGKQVCLESFKTLENTYTLDVRDFGAIGNSKTNSTAAIQAAICSCPKNGKILIPEGRYVVNSLFLKSDIEFEICENATLIADKNISNYPIFPDLIENYANKKYQSLGSWEGNPYKSYCSVINAINIENVKIYGKGIIDGNSSVKTWWKDPKHKETHIARPRLFFSNNSNHILIEGITFKNSPSWTIHPYLSDNIKIINVKIVNPKDSPNTDGIDPDCCTNISIIGVYFSLGDDCIAIKSGKIFMAQNLGKPTKSITIRQCHMKDGHAGVTLGSELACGIFNVIVKDCLFIDTDRGLRIKTRRGRGNKAIIDNIEFNNIKMNNVKIPFVINSYYFCDIDGHSSYVQTRKKLPIDFRTPSIGKLKFKNIAATNCHLAIASIEGLSEKPIEEVAFSNINISFDKMAKAEIPIMSDGIEKVCRSGFIINNVKKFKTEKIKVSNNVGPILILNGIEGKINE